MSTEPVLYKGMTDQERIHAVGAWVAAATAPEERYRRKSLALGMMYSSGPRGVSKTPGISHVDFATLEGRFVDEATHWTKEQFEATLARIRDREDESFTNPTGSTWKGLPVSHQAPRRLPLVRTMQALVRYLAHTPARAR